jgi:hydroxymethylglutaryl-CoA synthase
MSEEHMRPGIEAMEVYFPTQFVEQSALEKFDGVSEGKYTIGLGQDQIGFTSDFENVHSLALTVVANLMKKSNLSYNDIGRLSVSSETIIDKSKSIKSVVMQLFEESGNHDVEGCDYLNACYSGTAAFFDAINWIQDDEWDGRRAIVVAVDIAEYAPGPARPTGGAGAVAMLIGPNPVISLQRGRASFMKNTYDFYKPYLSSPFPVVDGKLSNECYLESVDECYKKLCEKRRQRQKKDTDLEDWDYCVFHSPYNKLVQKSFGRLMYNDFLMHPEKEEYANLQEFLKLDPSKTRSDRAVYKAFAKASKALYQDKVTPSTILPKAIGNCYSASVYIALASLIVEAEASDLQDANVLTFSYGSGLCSSIFHLRFSSEVDRIESLQRLVDYRHRLQDRIPTTPEVFNQVMDHKLEVQAKDHDHFEPKGPPPQLFPGTYRVVHRTEKGVHQYKEWVRDTSAGCTNFL